MTDEQVVDGVFKEYGECCLKHGAFASLHEGYAILKEEVDELWDEIKKKPEQRSPDSIRAEATQVAACAMRILLDFC